MKPAGALTAAELTRARHRKFTWCRLRNDFVDMPLWRVVAAELGMPLYQVQAFVVRLDSFANAALPRGYVGDFNAAEFGAALGMPSADALRIFQLLETDEVAWVVQSHVATFWERNPDKEDTSATERKQRERAFKTALKDLAKLARTGRLGEERRALLERELHALRDLARSGELPWSEQRARQAEVLRGALSTGHASHVVTGVTGSGAFETDSASRGLSTGHGCHNVTDRDIVTVTPRAEQNFSRGSVDNFGDGARREAAGSPTGERGAATDLPQTAEEWLRTEGQRIVTERMRIFPGVAATKIERWRREIAGDADAVAQMIDAVRLVDGDDFERAMQAQLEQRRRDATEQRRLPLLQLKSGGAA